MTIVIDTEALECKDLGEWREIIVKEGKDLADVLCAALPQGAVDQLLLELLDRRRSLMVVPMPSA